MTLHKLKTAAGALLTLSMCALALTFSRQCRDGAAKGLELCLSVLVPSLFPMMTLSGLTVRTGVCGRLGRLLEKPTRALFGLSGAFAPVILLSLIGGYPVGAKAIADLYRNGQVSRAQAKRASLFCVGAGPAFLMSFVGSALWDSAKTGAILLCAQTLSVMLPGIALRVFHGNAGDDFEKRSSTASVPFSCALVESVADASAAMLNICGLVVLFSAFSGICEEVFPQSAARDILLSLLDVSTGVCRLRNGYPLSLTAFAVGFGGLCVHFQIFAALGGSAVRKTLFFLFRIFQGVLTALFTHLGTIAVGGEVAVFSTAPVSRAGFYGGNVFSGAALMAVAVCFLLSFKQK